MSRAARKDDRTWASHPVRAAAIRVLAFVIPLVVSMLVGLAVSRTVAPPESLGGWVLWWALVLGASTAGLYGADRLARRLLPLATLMRLSMLFPDHAPSRIKVARRVAGSRAIVAEVQRHGHAGVAGDRQQAAETILALVGALGDYDSRTRGHSERTQLFVTLLADELKLSKEDKGRLMWAALVHDIGKLKVPHEVLNKPGRPSMEEWEVLQSHPHQGAVICEPLKQWLGEWWYAIEQHHERYDGGGYPRGLAGAEISYGARIVSVADSYEVMTASRPYKKPMPALAAREELTRNAGTQFDPDVVRAFLNISLGRMHRAAGPLAWLFQVLAVRPGPIGSQILGGVVSAAGATAAVVGLQLGATADDTPVRPERPAAANPVERPTPTTDAPSPRRDAPTQTPQPPRRPTADVLPVAVPPSAEPSAAPSAAPTRDATAEPPAPPAPERGGNRAPQSAPLSRVTDEDGGGLAVDLLAEASDADGDALTVTSLSAASHGTVVDRGDGRIRYTPERDFHGTEGFVYTVVDGQGGESEGRLTVVVRPTPDAPSATPDTAWTIEDSGGVTLALLDNDTDADGDVLSVASVTGARNGSVTAGSGGVWSYRPGRDFAGVEQLTYRVVDPSGLRDTGTVTVTVVEVNDPPTARDDTLAVDEDAASTAVDVLANDSSAPDTGETLGLVAGSLGVPAHGTATSGTGPQAGTVLYTPDPDYQGFDSFTYEVEDGRGGRAAATVFVAVATVNDPPVANADAATLDEDTVAVVDVLANDGTGPDAGETLTIAAGSVTTPANGTAVIGTGVNADRVVYTPNPNFAGPDSFDYDVSDGNGGFDTATVTVTVREVNDPPQAVADTQTILEDDPTVTVAVLVNDTDADADTLSLVPGSVTGATLGRRRGGDRPGRREDPLHAGAGPERPGRDHLRRLGRTRRHRHRDAHGRHHPCQRRAGRGSGRPLGHHRGGPVHPRGGRGGAEQRQRHRRRPHHRHLVGQLDGRDHRSGRLDQLSADPADDGDGPLRGLGRHRPPDPWDAHDHRHRGTAGDIRPLPRGAPEQLHPGRRVDHATRPDHAHHRHRRRRQRWSDDRVGRHEAGRDGPEEVPRVGLPGPERHAAERPRDPGPVDLARGQGERGPRLRRLGLRLPRRDLQPAHIDGGHPHRQLEHHHDLGAAHRDGRQRPEHAGAGRAHRPGQDGVQPQGRVAAARRRHGLQPEPDPVTLRTEPGAW